MGSPRDSGAGPGTGTGTGSGARVPPGLAGGRAAGYEFRAAADWAEFGAVLDLAYGGYPHSAAHSAVAGAVFEPKRSLVACRGGRVCATLAGYALEMTLPGGPAPVAGIGYVAVAPQHRRRGLMRELVRRALTALHEERAEPVAVLHSTEPGIYGRFGFGPASQVVGVSVPPEARGFAAGPETGGLVSDVGSPVDARAAVAEVYDACLAQRPGLVRRDDAWLRRAFEDRPEERHGAGRLLCMVASGAGGDARGYALYRLRANWERCAPRYALSVREVFARDPAAYAFLWRSLLDTDLAGAVGAAARPVDDPLLALLDDPRSAAPTVRDQLYARAVDLDRALAARTYSAPVEVVMEVRDAMCPWNAGRWRLAGGVDGAVCVRTGAAADLALTARELGAVLLGGGSLVQLGHAGLVTELRPGALRAASAAFRHDPAPFCSVAF
ncbi:GNAT family N-acetyltransferase [Streptomyces sp. NPDC017056]|uniref:GNAT family N-acetyltransferase n=1 Tax=Streptomyces sp. NPDC017056 TaxID=3364973 RepID=UPI0037875BC2